MESQPLWKGATMRTNRIRNNESSLEHCLCPVRCPFYSSVLKIVTTYPPPPNPYISETAFSHRFQKAYTYPPPPPEVTTFWCIRPKVEKTLPKCKFAPCWHLLDVPERYDEQDYTSSSWSGQKKNSEWLVPFCPAGLL